MRLTLAPRFRRVPGRGLSPRTVFFLFRDVTRLTVPTRQLARAILSFAVASGFPRTLGTMQLTGADAPKPTTSTGVERPVGVPSPSWPERLSPQHLTPPVLVRAQVCS